MRQNRSAEWAGIKEGVSPPQPTRGSGDRRELPAWSGAEPRPPTHFCHIWDSQNTSQNSVTTSQQSQFFRKNPFNRRLGWGGMAPCPSGYAPARRLCNVRRWCVLSVCLSVSNLTLKLLKGFSRKFHDTTDLSEVTENWLNFGVIRLRIRIQEFFWRIFQHCEIGHFPIIWLTSPERVIGFSWTFYHRWIVGQESRS